MMKKILKNIREYLRYCNDKFESKPYYDEQERADMLRRMGLEEVEEYTGYKDSEGKYKHTKGREWHV